MASYPKNGDYVGATAFLVVLPVVSEVSGYALSWQDQHGFWYHRSGECGWL
jgi:hypothetical protein